MSPEEKIEAAQKLIAEAKAGFAAKKRNWPEKIEAGMVFSEPNGSSNAWFAAGVGFACVSGSCLGMWRETLPSGCHYIGKDCISIRIRKDTDAAHEPTGAELVGKLCEFSDDGKAWTKPGECDEFDPSDREMAYHSAVESTLAGDDGRKWFEFARLAR